MQNDDRAAEYIGRMKEEGVCYNLCFPLSRSLPRHVTLFDEDTLHSKPISSFVTINLHISCTNIAEKQKHNNQFPHHDNTSEYNFEIYS